MLGWEARWRVTNPEACTRFQRALVPNIEFLIHVPNQDRDRHALPQRMFADHIKAAFSRLCGGHAPPSGGDAADYEGQREHTVVLSTYLPEIVTDDLRDELLQEVLTFGALANQEVVLTAIGGLAHRFRFARAVNHEEHNGVVSQRQVAQPTAR